MHSDVTMKILILAGLVLTAILFVLRAVYFQFSATATYDEETEWSVDAEMVMEYDGHRMIDEGFGSSEPSPISDIMPVAPPQPEPTPQTLEAYLDTYHFPDEFSGYSYDGKLMLLNITDLRKVGGYYYVGYKKSVFGSGTTVTRGEGKLHVDTQKLQLPFADYTITITNEGTLLLEAKGWSNTPFTTLEEARDE